MSVSNNYTFIGINSNNTFYISELETKPDSAAVSLAKIELIFKKRLTYDPTCQDEYSKLPQGDLLTLLEQKSSSIRQGYMEKCPKLLWMTGKFFSQETEVSTLYTSIHHYLKPPQGVPTANDPFQEIAKHLGVSDVAALARLNRQGKTLATTAMIRRARDFGYEGRDCAEASKYIERLFKEVDDLAKLGVIPKVSLFYKDHSFLARIIASIAILSFPVFVVLSYYVLSFPVSFVILLFLVVPIIMVSIFSIEDQKFDSERILKRLGSLTLDNMLDMLSNPKFCCYSFILFRKIFDPLLKQKIVTFDRDAVEQKGALVLLVASSIGDKKGVELLLQLGVNINIKNEAGLTPLMMASISRNIETAKFLIDSGADVNVVDNWGNTALLYSDSVEITRLLLESQRLTTLEQRGVHYVAGHTPLLKAVYRGSIQQVQLLLQYGANVNTRDPRGATPLTLARRCRHHEIEVLLLAHGAVI